MVMTLKVILAISALLGITSTTPLQLMAKFRRSALEKDDFPVKGNLRALGKNITEAENILKQKCGDVAINKVNFDFNGNISCSEYKKTFCSVNKALQNLTRTNCSDIIPRFMIPKAMSEVNCSESTQQINLKTFAYGLKSFIENLIINCPFK